MRARQRRLRGQGEHPAKRVSRAQGRRRHQRRAEAANKSDDEAARRQGSRAHGGGGGDDDAIDVGEGGAAACVPPRSYTPALRMYVLYVSATLKVVSVSAASEFYRVALAGS